LKWNYLNSKQILIRDENFICTESFLNSIIRCCYLIIQTEFNAKNLEVVQKIVDDFASFNTFLLVTDSIFSSWKSRSS
jgi:hypothetical protein